MLHLELEDEIKLLHADSEPKQLWVCLISHLLVKCVGYGLDEMSEVEIAVATEQVV
jgi:hypothetical protein